MMFFGAGKCTVRMIVSCFECRAILERFSSPVLILPDHRQNSNNFDSLVLFSCNKKFAEFINSIQSEVWLERLECL